MRNRDIKKIEEKVYKYIKTKKLLEKDDILMLAVSGGPDSVFLLYMLNKINIKYKYNWKINVVCMNHLLREEAKEETEYVQKLAKSLNYDFYLKEVNISDISKKEGISTELAGRRERQKFFKEVEQILVKKYDIEKKDKIKIVLGHHKDDEIETFFLNLIRGSGISGLSSIKPINENKIRPLLCLFKEEILEYLDHENIKYYIDKTNFELDHYRNKVRNIIIPLIEKEFFEGAKKSISRTIDNLKKEEKYISNVVNEKYSEIIKNKTEIDILKLKKLNEFILERIIIKILKENSKEDKINYGIIEDIKNIIYKGNGNKKVIFQNEIVFKIEKGILKIEDIIKNKY